MIDLRFRIEGIEGAFRVGSRMFPVADKDSMAMFTKDNTHEITNEAIRSVIDDLASKFVDGRCYMNTEMIVNECEKRGIEGVDFYAGWMFADINRILPVHHCWAVYENNVIDISIRKSLYNALKDIDYNNPYWREDNIYQLKQEEKHSRKNLSSNCMMGHIFLPFIYVGSIDECENARKTYRDILAEFPNHPLYSKGNPHGASRLQHLMGLDA